MMRDAHVIIIALVTHLAHGSLLAKDTSHKSCETMIPPDGEMSIPTKHAKIELEVEPQV